MSEEQRAAATERLAKAREARGHDGSKSVHPDLLEVDEDSSIHWKKIREWIKEISTELTSKKSLRTSKESKERQEYQILEVYLGNLKRYLESGVYSDSRYGRQREGKMKTIVHAIAYYPNGRPKRTLGWYYHDCGEYTQEMKDNDDRIYGTDTGTGRGYGSKFHEQETVLEDGGEDCSGIWDDLSR